MITVTVKLFAGHRAGRFREARFTPSPGTTAGALLAELGLDDTKSAILLVNGRAATAGRILADNDILALFPPVSGG